MKLTALSPILESTDIPGTIEFYSRLLGFAVRGSFENEGMIVWCEMVRDEVAIMFSKPNENTKHEKPLLTGSIYINVKDVDSCWEALKDKCEVVYPIGNFIYRMREFAIKDNNGYVLNFGESIEK
jgi:uncharacterized glyoxalase superfamily protein PhnB